METAKKPMSVLQEAALLTQQGEYEEALQKYLWFHKHALEHTPALIGVRLSFALDGWFELAKKYPKALQALIDIRDEAANTATRGQGSLGAFFEAAAINGCLEEGAKTVALFKQIRQISPELAERCYPIAEPYLAANQEYAICSSYIPDAAARFENIRVVYESGIRVAKATPEYGDEEPEEFALETFIPSVCRVVEILLGAGRRPEAEKVRDLALALNANPKTRESLDTILPAGEPER